MTTGKTERSPRSLRVMLPPAVAAGGVEGHVGDTRTVRIKVAGSGVTSCHVSAKSSSKAFLLQMAAADLTLEAGSAVASLTVKVLAPSEPVWVQVDALADGEVYQAAGFFMRGSE